MKTCACVFFPVVALLLSSCGDPAAQMSIMADSYKEQLESKDKEIARLRETEKNLSSELAGLKATVETLQSEMEKARSASQGIDADKVAAMIVKELEPKMDPIISKSVKTTLESASLTSTGGGSTTSSQASTSTGRQPVPDRSGGTPQNTGQNSGQSASGQNSSGSSGNGVTVRQSGRDPNVRRFEFTFP